MRYTELRIQRNSLKIFQHTSLTLQDDSPVYDVTKSYKLSLMRTVLNLFVSILNLRQASGYFFALEK